MPSITPWTIDNPKTRAGVLCPVCFGPKSIGNVICWPCNRYLKARHDGGWGQAAESTIIRFEAEQV